MKKNKSRTSRKNNDKYINVFKFGKLRRSKKVQTGLHQMGWLVAALLVLTMPFTNSVKNKFGVLAYSTEMGQQSLLDSTNQQRQSNGAGNLIINSKLTSAAQAKANDMATRNYWSHNTPEGNPPWVFINDAGYQYKKAGENLAYGFATSADTITGWMNSPPHKANLIDPAFTEVGFGFANNANYQSNGEETIVVAMYGQPYISEVCPSGQSGTPPNCVATPSTPETVVPKEITITPEVVKPVESKPFVSTNKSQPEPAQKGISRIQTFSKGKAAWSTAAVSIAMLIGICIWITKHLLVVRKMFSKGEKFVVHHPLLDIALLAFTVLAFLAIQSTGFIK